MVNPNNLETYLHYIYIPLGFEFRSFRFVIIAHILALQVFEASKWMHSHLSSILKQDPETVGVMILSRISGRFRRPFNLISTRSVALFCSVLSFYVFTYLSRFHLEAVVLN